MSKLMDMKQRHAQQGVYIFRPQAKRLEKRPLNTWEIAFGKREKKT